MDMDHEEEVATQNVSDDFLSLEDLKFIRTFIGHRMITVSDTMKAYRAIFNVNDEESFNARLKIINDGVRGGGVKLQLTTCEVTGCQYYLWIQTNYNKSFLWPSKYTKKDLCYFKRIIQELLSTEYGYLTLVETLNLSADIISLSLAEKAVEGFINDKWIIESKEKRLFLSPLAIAELEPFLKDHFSNQLRYCELCNKIIFHGNNCRHCNCIIHKRCFEMYNDDYCPRCKSLFRS